MNKRLVTMLCLLAATSSTVLANGQAAAVDAMRSTFSSHPVSKVTLSGTATWYAGSLKDSGTVTLTAASDGSARMQLALGQSGERTESQLAIGPSMKCQWSGADAKVHQADYLNCLKPAVWFLPSLSLQSSSMPASISVSDLGVETASASGYRHLRAQFASSAIGDLTAIPNASEAATADIDIDPKTSLPESLRYKVRPDSGADVQIPIVVKFSDYRNVNGVEVPYLIERYVNGTLQLQITIQSSQIE